MCMLDMLRAVKSMPGVARASSVVLPSAAVVKAVAFSCEPLWRLRQAVGVVHGVDMTAMNVLHWSAR